ncbi:MAG: ABC transporter substrate-binding protein [Spirochaetia bacterium]|jgi:hypothetical protein|nr:ABC transporter substrate-binding protein [Spirochaetia bacterium]
MKKKFFSGLLAVLLVCLPVTAQAQIEQQASAGQKTYLASNTWTVAFAELGGLDNVRNLAPANLVHPPEYELTPSDIKALSTCSLFIYAGYEVMMKTLGDSTLPQDKMVKITTTNDLATVKSSAAIIAKKAGTEVISEKRVAAYEQMIIAARKMVKDQGLDKLSCYVNSHQVDFAKDIGLDVKGTFGPGPVTPAQIKEAKDGKFDLIIDNIHNPLANPLCEVSLNSKLIVWRNFPENLGPDALLKMEQANIQELSEAFQKQ